MLARHIEDQSNNTTRFLVMAPEPRPAPVEGALTTFVFRVRNLPAALYKALGGFATNGVNMTKLESYMIDGQFTATQFYADIEGHPEDPPVARALEELAYFTTKLQILGVYPRNPFRAGAGQPGAGGGSAPERRVPAARRARPCRCSRRRSSSRRRRRGRGSPRRPWCARRASLPSSDDVAHAGAGRAGLHRHQRAVVQHHGVARRRPAG